VSLSGKRDARAVLSASVLFIFFFVQFHARPISHGGAGPCQNSVRNSGSIDVPAADKSLVIDSLKRGESRTVRIQDHKAIWRVEQNAVSLFRAVYVSSHNPTSIINPEENCSRGARRIEWRRAIVIPVEAVHDERAVEKFPHVLVRGIELVSNAGCGSWNINRRDAAANADKRLKEPDAAAGNVVAGKVSGVVYSRHAGSQGASDIVLCKGPARQEISVLVAIAAHVITADYA